jgi:hypothetical protein
VVHTTLLHEDVNVSKESDRVGALKVLNEETKEGVRTCKAFVRMVTVTP